MSTEVTTPKKMPYYVTLEVIPSGKTGTGSLLAALVADESETLTVNFNVTIDSIDSAIESLLAWVYKKIDPATYEIEFIVWNKDDFARLMYGTKWLSLNSLCFLSYYASLMNLSMAEARHALSPPSLPSDSVGRVQQMATMFRGMKNVSELIRQAWDIIALVGKEFNFGEDK